MRKALIAGMVVLVTTSGALGANVKDLGANGLDSGIKTGSGKGGSIKGAIADQAAGNFGALERETVPGGAIQGAWDKAEPEAGIYLGKWNPTRVLRMRVREGMTSIIALPTWDSVSAFTLADQFNFDARRVPDHPGYIEIWTKVPGFDTNITIVGKSGNIYPIYVRGETWNSKHIPDVVIYVRAVEPGPGEAGAAKEAKKGVGKAVEESAKALAAEAPEWLRRKRFDPFDVRHDREMSGDEAIAPELIFRDNDMTFLDFGENSRDWPAVFEVKDGVDVPVRFRTSKSGRFMGIETVGPLTLRLGEKTVCIRASS